MVARTVAVVAATGRLGRAVVGRLKRQGDTIIAIGRDPSRLNQMTPHIIPRVADLTVPETMKTALHGAEIIISCANAGHFPAIISQLPETVQRIVIMGSTRLFSAKPDATTTAVKQAEKALQTLQIPHVLLLSTMIYGGGGSVIDAWARLVGKYSILPVPAGREALIQPIHIEDVAEAIVAATLRDSAPGTPIIIAGGEILTQHEMIKRVALALNRSVYLVPIPAGIIAAIGSVTGAIPRLSSRASALNRLLENRSFELHDMQERLGVYSRGLDLRFFGAR